MVPLPGLPNRSPRARDRWMAVELRHLDALQAIAREGSVGGAAESLGYVASAVSQQLTQLERLVGVRLVERPRGNGPLALTDAGGLLLEHTQEILARYELAATELVALGEGRLGTLRVGIHESVAPRMLPPVLRRFAERCPGVVVALTEWASDGPLLRALHHGGVDLAFCELPLHDEPFETEALMDDPVLLMTSASAGVPQAPGPHDLAGRPLVGYRNWRGQANVWRFLRNHGIEPDIAYEFDHDSTVQGVVAADMAVALAPYLAIDSARPETTVARISPSPPPRTIGLAWHAEREQGAGARTFREVAQACAEELAQSVDRDLLSDRPLGR